MRGARAPRRPGHRVLLALETAAARPLLVVLRALGLGDLLSGVPALRALADAFPGHRRVLAAPAALAPLAALVGAVDAVVPTEPLAPLDPGLLGAAVAVNLHGRGPESHRVLLEAEPARLVAFAHAQVPESAGSPEWRACEHEVERWCRLLTDSGLPADPRRLGLDPPPPPAGEAARGATIVHPGAASGGRRWPPERFAAVARAELERGREVVVTGGRRERELGLEVARLAGLPAEAVLAGRTELLELASLVAAAGSVVCGDTGIAHLATAFGTPSVVLFGPVSPSLWGPPPGRSQHRTLWAGESSDPHAATPAAGLLSLTVEDVLAALATLPHRAASRGQVLQ